MGKGEWVKGSVKCKIQPIGESSGPVWKKFPGWLYCLGYFGARKDNEYCRRWWLIHLQTGRTLGSFKTLKAIKIVVSKLMKLGIDWGKVKRSDQKKKANVPMIMEVQRICKSLEPPGG